MILHRPSNDTSSFALFYKVIGWNQKETHPIKHSLLAANLQQCRIFSWITYEISAMILHPSKTIFWNRSEHKHIFSTKSVQISMQE